MEKNKNLAKIYDKAKENCENLNHGWIDTDHLLSALFFTEEDNPFLKLLNKRGVPVNEARSQVKRIIKDLHNQLDEMIQKYGELLEQKKNRLAGELGMEVADRLFINILDSVDSEILEILKSGRIKNMVKIRLQRWVRRPHRESFWGSDWVSEILREFADILPEFGSEWVLSEDSVQVPEGLVNNLKQTLSGTNLSAEERDALLFELIDLEEKFRSFLLNLSKQGIDPRRITYGIKRYIFRAKKIPEDSYYTEKVFEEAENRAKNEGRKEITISDVVDALLSLPNTFGGSILSQLFKGTNVKDVKREMAEEEKSALERFTVDLTEMARQGKLDPIIGREKEIQQVIEILSRRQKNNPVLIGDAGVGKTAVVEGIAQRIVKGEVPENLKNKRILSLDMGGIIAGTRYRGDFEERLKKLVDEIKNSDDVILFIDEIHNVVGAGRAEGAPDAANLIKPALARGDFQVIGATTVNEYRKYIEKDPALERRFQPVWIDEPDVETTKEILRGIRPRYEEHHGVIIEDEALDSAAKLTARYVQDRKLPDKAIDAMDQAAARKKLKKAYPDPEEMEKLNRLERMKTELERLKRMGEEDKARELEKEIEKINASLSKDKGDKKEIREKELEKEIEKLKEDIREAEKKEDIELEKKLKIELIEKESQLKKLKKENGKPEDKVRVSAEDVAEVVAEWTGIPVSKMMEEEKKKLLDMEDTLHRRIVGQEHAVQAVSQAIRRARAGVSDPRRPLGSFLFLGPTGVGKTELAKTLAEYLFNDEDAIIRLDMSEFMERHSVAKLIGAPPGYVGHEEGGQLTERVRRKPYSVILFDEIEKAHPDVFNALLQILDDGRLTDSKGRTVSFRNTVIIMTSNLGSRYLMQLMDKFNVKFEELEKRKKAGQNVEEEEKKLMEEFDREFKEAEVKVLEEVKRFFRPEFLNRIDEIVVFHPLKKEHIIGIVDLMIAKLNKRLKENGLRVELTEKAKELLASEGFDPTHGARPLKRLIQKKIETPLSEMILKGEVKEGDVVIVDEENDKLILKRAS